MATDPAARKIEPRLPRFQRGPAFAARLKRAVAVPPRALRGTYQRLIKYKIARFSPKVTFEVNVGDFTLKTATTADELWQLLELRYAVFIQEAQNRTGFRGVDFDRYDLLADHIVVQDRRNGSMIGTYRLIASPFAQQFYSQHEFHMDRFLRSPGIKLEMGRACIHPDYRDGKSLSVVWRGLGAYATLIDADYMFGCSSLQTTDLDQAMALYWHLGAQYTSRRYRITPRLRYRGRPSLRRRKGRMPYDIRSVMPPLLRSYLNAGARIYGQPALDRAFRCIDFLTILNIRRMNPKYHARYFQRP